MAEKQVLIEIQAPGNLSRAAILDFIRESLLVPGLIIDQDYLPVPTRPPQGLELPAGESLYTLRGRIDSNREEELKQHPRVIQVWVDTPIAPMNEEDDPDRPRLGF